MVCRNRKSEMEWYARTGGQKWNDVQKHEVRNGMVYRNRKSEMEWYAEIGSQKWNGVQK